MWQLILGIGFIFLILEMFTPSMFFLNFAISAFICAGLSFLTHNIFILTIVFSVLSVILIYTLRPLLMKNMEAKQNKTGLEAKYIGKSAKVVEEINASGGAISLYGERWQAKSTDNSVIEAGSTVEIVSNDSLIMNVKKIGE